METINMEYIDNQLINTDTCKIMTDKFNQSLTQTTHDLIDIRSRLISQRKHLSSQNNTQYDHIISSLSTDISTLDRIIDSQTLSATPHTKTDLSRLNHSQTTPIDPSRLQIHRPIDIPEGSNFDFNNNNTNNNSDNNNFNPNNNIDLNRPQTRGRSLFRRSPMHSNSIIAGFRRSIINNMRHTNNPKATLTSMCKDLDRNKFHNLYQEDSEHNLNTQSHNCDPCRKATTNQIDLIRLLVLFIALHPCHPHLPKICHIADNQMSCLLTLI